MHELLQSPEVAALQGRFSHEALLRVTRVLLQELRVRLREENLPESTLAGLVEGLPRAIIEKMTADRPKLQRVLNGTGVLLQTNLGRAPLSADALRRIAEIASGYCNVEFNLETGNRSRRDDLVEKLLLDVATRYAPEGKSAAVVNNCAAATLLALNTLAEGGEVIVSRGELVEIGGGFRVPEILEKSGAKLVEVGTTNKTRLSDYRQALTERTRLILRVHRSNFRIEGFTEQPALRELAVLGREHGVPVFDDQGTGCVVDLADFGLSGESSWRESIASGVSLVAASGDKLLGGPQCGLLVGESKIVEAVRANPLFRALRVDKLTYAALEATLEAYAQDRQDDLPLMAMLRLSADSIRDRAERCAALLQVTGWSVEVLACRSVVGGGTTPGASLPSFALALHPQPWQADQLVAHLRALEPPVIGRICEDRVLLDLRTIAEVDDELLLSQLTSLRDQP